MRFRCAQCRALTQVQIPARMTAPVVTACSGCGRRYRFAVDRPRAADDQERYRRAKEFAETNQIDLGSRLLGPRGGHDARGGAQARERAAAAGSRSTIGQPPALPPIQSTPAATGGAVAPRPTLPVRPARVSRKPSCRRPKQRPRRSRPGTRFENGPDDADARHSQGGDGPAGGGRIGRRHDPGFAAAVLDGCLSPQRRWSVATGGPWPCVCRCAIAADGPGAPCGRQPRDRPPGVAAEGPAGGQGAAASADLRVPRGVEFHDLSGRGDESWLGLGGHVYHVWGEYLAQRGMAVLEPVTAAAATRAHVTAPAGAPAVPAPPPPMTVPKSDAAGSSGVVPAPPGPRPVP